MIVEAATRTSWQGAVEEIEAAGRPGRDPLRAR